jgi:hypothetical protein
MGADATPYPLHLAVDLLDQLVDSSARGAPDRTAIMRGAIALALHASDLSDDLVATLRNLESLALDQVEALDDRALARAAQVASHLRRRIGVH